MSIKMVEPEKIILTNCIFDKDNPNEMSDEQTTSLGYSLTEFGYLGDLIVVEPLDKKGKHFVHHGEHRIKKLIESGNTWAWGFIQKMSKLKHKAYRQAMNKLRGSHDPEKDRLELAFFAKQNKLDFLSQLIAQPKEQLIIAQQVAPIITTDKGMIGHHHDTFLEGTIKQLYFMFNNEQYEKIMPKMAKLEKIMKTANHTDIFIRLVNFYLNNNKK